MSKPSLSCVLPGRRKADERDYGGIQGTGDDNPIKYDCFHPSSLSSLALYKAEADQFNSVVQRRKDKALALLACANMSSDAHV